MYNILNGCGFLLEENIKKIEEHYKAKYVFESCLKSVTGNWTSMTAAIFYTEEAHPQGSNYFGLYFNNKNFMITNGISAIEPFEGILIDNDVVYSRHRHDYRCHNGIFVDGGRDYLRWGGERYNDARIVKITINKDKLEVNEDAVIP